MARTGTRHLLSTSPTWSRPPVSPMRPCAWRSRSLYPVVRCTARSLAPAKSRARRPRHALFPQLFCCSSILSVGTTARRFSDSTDSRLICWNCVAWHRWRKRRRRRSWPDARSGECSTASASWTWCPKWEAAAAVPTHRWATSSPSNSSSRITLAGPFIALLFFDELHSLNL